MHEEGINVWCIVATIVAIGIALFLAIHPSNSPSLSNVSLASVVGQLLIPWVLYFFSPLPDLKGTDRSSLQNFYARHISITEPNDK